MYKNTQCANLLTTINNIWVDVCSLKETFITYTGIYNSLYLVPVIMLKDPLDNTSYKTFGTENLSISLHM